MTLTFYTDPADDLCIDVAKAFTVASNVEEYLNTDAKYNHTDMDMFLIGVLYATGRLRNEKYPDSILNSIKEQIQKQPYGDYNKKFKVTI